jgi:hypothetical protein
MRIKMTLCALFISSAFATPTFANYFHNPYLNLNLNVGSAPSPTPRDIRENRLPQVHTAPSATGAIDTIYRSRLTPSRRGEALPNSAPGRRPA